MPTKTAVTTLGVLPWKEETRREYLLALRMWQLQGRSEDVAERYGDNGKLDSETNKSSIRSIGYDHGRSKKETGDCL